MSANGRECKLFFRQPAPQALTGMASKRATFLGFSWRSVDIKHVTITVAFVSKKAEWTNAPSHGSTREFLGRRQLSEPLQLIDVSAKGTMRLQSMSKEAAGPRGARCFLFACRLLFVNLGWLDAARSDDIKPDTDKSAYTLFNPTPNHILRPLTNTTDRPGKMDSPFTVDAGHVQVESDFLDYLHSNDGIAGSRYFATADPNIKVGVTNSIDLEVNINGYRAFATHDDLTGALAATGHGFGDLYLRSKINLVGNDKGDFILALFPYLKAPTAAHALGNGLVEGGLLVPTQLNLPSGFTLQFMSEVDALKRAKDSKRYANFVNIITLSHTVISKDLTAAVEFFSSVGTDPATPPVYTFDVNLAYLLTEALQIDVGANFGLNKNSPNFEAYTGVSVRF